MGPIKSPLIDAVTSPRIRRPGACSRWARGRVLVIDDEPLLRGVFRKILERYYAVELADCGRAGLEKLRRDRNFDVIICDINMPDMDGQMVLRQLAQVAPEYRSRVVFCTGDPVGAENRAFARHLDNPILEKPCSMDDLIDAVWRVIERDGRSMRMLSVVPSL